MAGKGSANLIHTRRLGRRFILCGDGVSDVETSGTLFSARVMACAAHEALAVIRIIAGDFDNANVKE
jgi:sulfur carrier protein ThiS adenylyltransferase